MGGEDPELGWVSAAAHLEQMLLCRAEIALLTLEQVMYLLTQVNGYSRVNVQTGSSVARG